MERRRGNIIAPTLAIVMLPPLIAYVLLVSAGHMFFPSQELPSSLPNIAVLYMAFAALQIASSISNVDYQRISTKQRADKKDL